MSKPIELDDLSSRRTKVGFQTSKLQDDLSDNRGPEADDPNDQTVAVWTWASTVILLAIALPLILFPRFLLFVSETAVERRNALTPLEAFLALNTGLLLFTFALALVFNMPSHEPVVRQQLSAVRSHPLLGPLTGACILVAFTSYNTTSVGSLSFVVFLGSATIGLWGLWAIMFAGSSYISRKTGADKRTSRFLFGNKAAASTQKKQWKQEQQEKRRS